MQTQSLHAYVYLIWPCVSIRICLLSVHQISKASTSSLVQKHKSEFSKLLTLFSRGQSMQPAQLLDWHKIFKNMELCRKIAFKNTRFFFSCSLWYCWFLSSCYSVGLLPAKYSLISYFSAVLYLLYFFLIVDLI